MLGPASLGLAPATVSVSVEDADSDVYQLDAGTLPADGRPHTLAVTLANQAVPSTAAARAGGAAGTAKAIYPVRLTGISLDYTMPASQARVPAAFTVDSVSGGPGTAADRRAGAARVGRRRHVHRTGWRQADPRHGRPVRHARGLVRR